MKKQLPLLLAVLLLSACTSLSSRIKQEGYQSWTPRIQRAVDGGQIIQGMNKWQVMAVTDIPELLVQKRTTLVGENVLETWVVYKSFGSYYFSNPGLASTVIINFSNGTVSAVSF